MSGTEGSDQVESTNPREVDDWRQGDHDNADLRIISSDNHEFWVPSTLLARHSPVFRSMLTLGGSASDTVTLTDPDFEHVELVRVILEIIDNFESDNEHDFRSVSDDQLSAELVFFAKKYDMKLVIHSIKMCLFGFIAQFPPRGGEHCMIAAHLGEWVLCLRLIESLDEWQGPDLDDEGEYPPVKLHMRKMLDWRGWTPEIMDTLGKVSTRFTWAICQAGTHNTTTRADRIDYKSMGRDLASLMIMHPSLAEIVCADWDKPHSPWWSPS